MTETTTTEYQVVCPPQSPPIRTMGKGHKIGELTVVKRGTGEQHGIYHCWDCSRGFHHDARPVIVTFTGNPNESDPGELMALHVDCAEDYRKRHVPYVVTVHPDGTATVTGPGDNASHGKTVTVVIEAK